MKMELEVRNRLVRNGLLSLFIYALPVLAMLVVFSVTGQKPWLSPPEISTGTWYQTLKSTSGNGLIVFTLALGLVELMLGMYGKRFDRNEKTLDLVCYVIPKLLIRPLIAWVSLRIWPALFPGLQGNFAFVPFWWGFLILCVADDLTQYWYHRLHHEIPFLWRFHRTHHSAPYMGVSVTNRQNLLYYFFFSQTYVTSILVYFGLGAPAIVLQTIKSLIIILAHSSLPWDRPLYRHAVLHPLAWILERTISTPATHHAHHSDSSTDGVGYYKGNFGNMLFLWDVIFGTALITRKYPARYGITHYRNDPWQAQLLWPFVKSTVEGSELSADGPVVAEDLSVPEDLANVPSR